MGVWECFGLELNRSPVISYLNLEERLNLSFSDKENWKEVLGMRKLLLEMVNLYL